MGEDPDLPRDRAMCSMYIAVVAEELSGLLEASGPVAVSASSVAHFPSMAVVQGPSSKPSLLIFCYKTACTGEVLLQAARSHLTMNQLKLEGEGEILYQGNDIAAVARLVAQQVQAVTRAATLITPCDDELAYSSLPATPAKHVFPYSEDLAYERDAARVKHPDGDTVSGFLLPGRSPASPMAASVSAASSDVVDKQVSPTAVSERELDATSAAATAATAAAAGKSDSGGEGTPASDAAQESDRADGAISMDEASEQAAPRDESADPGVDGSTDDKGEASATAAKKEQGNTDNIFSV